MLYSQCIVQVMRALVVRRFRYVRPEIIFIRDSVFAPQAAIIPAGTRLDRPKYTPNNSGGRRIIWSATARSSYRAKAVHVIIKMVKSG